MARGLLPQGDEDDDHLEGVTGTGDLDDTSEVTGEANISQIETVSGNVMCYEASGAVMCSRQH